MSSVSMVFVLDYRVWYVILMLKSTKIDSLALIVMLRVINLKIKTIVSLFVKWSSYHCMLSCNDLELERIWEICEMQAKPEGLCWICKVGIRVILWFNMTFGRELVVLLAKPSMLGKFLVHAWEVVWRFEQRTFYFGSWRVKLILACQEWFVSLD